MNKYVSVCVRGRERCAWRERRVGCNRCHCCISPVVPCVQMLAGKKWRKGGWWMSLELRVWIWQSKKHCQKLGEEERRRETIFGERGGKKGGRRLTHVCEKNLLDMKATELLKLAAAHISKTFPIKWKSRLWPHEPLTRLNGLSDVNMRESEYYGLMDWLVSTLTHAWPSTLFLPVQITFSKFWRPHPSWQLHFT